MISFTASEGKRISERLAYGTTLHSDIKTKLQTMVRAGKSHIDKRRAQWQSVDHSLRMYADLRAKEKYPDGSDTTRLARPHRLPIIVPLESSLLFSRQVQKWQMLTGQDPIVHLEGRENADWKAARVVEAMVNYDLELSESLTLLWQLSMDDERYGVGILYDSWEEDWGWSIRPSIDPSIASLLPPDMAQLAEARRDWTLKRQYVKWKTIDPHRYIPDPAVPIVCPQDGDYCGHWEIVSWSRLRRSTMAEGGVYFNVKAAREQGGGRDTIDGDGAGRTTTGDIDTSEETYPVRELVSIQVRLIPSEWGLGDSDQFQIWHFALWADSVIVRAHPSIYFTDQFSYSVGEGNLDLHAPFVPSEGELLEGLQTMADWLFSSHVDNVRAAVNNRLLYDRGLIEERDLLQPGPMAHVRLSSEGQRLVRNGIVPIGNFVHQLRVQDVTKSHLEVIQQLMAHAQEITGANANTLGQVFPKIHRLGEIEAVNSSSNARIGAAARLLDVRCIAATARRNIMLRQQLTSGPQIIRISGQLAKQLGERQIQVTPDQLAGEYDIIARTSTASSDPARQAAVWMSIIQLIAQFPQLLQPRDDGMALNPHDILDQAVRAHGINYLESLYAPPRPVQFAPMDQVQQMAQAGDAVPLQGGLM